MCGIAGILNLKGEPVSPVLLRKMTDAIAHRGPDSEGWYVDRYVGLGHRRLSIIDLSPAGNQPMITPDSRYAITYNGEIYNFREIRAKLQTLGHQFQSKTDTEVVLHAFIEWGAECLNQLNGMFAFAILDKAHEELFLARDRYGIKPLYYFFTEGLFIFSSEQKAIITHPDVRRIIDLDALVEYFTFQNIFTNRTFLKNIKLFPAGHYAHLPFGSNDNDLHPVQYWDFDFQNPVNPLSEQEYIEELDRLFRQAVNRQLISDVDIGTYLSGGMDSGSITAIAAQNIPYIKSFTCGFDLNSASGIEVNYDERNGAEYMSYLFKTEHYEMVLKAGDMERIMPQMAWCIEEPRVGQSYPNYYIAQLAAKFVKVVLAGTGGDELFGGYPWRYYRITNNKANFNDYIDKYYTFWQRLIPNRVIQEVFNPVWNDVKHVWTRNIFCDVFKKHEHNLRGPEDYINHSLYFEAKTFLHGLLLIEDKLSMAHSLETRVPFLDNDLVDYASIIPVHLKLKNLHEMVTLNENEPGLKKNQYYRRTGDGKLILRKVMQRYVPIEITEKEKQGFSAPDASWFKGESIDYVRRTLFNKRARIYDYMDAGSIKQLVDEHLEGKENRRLLIWSLLNLENWCNKFL